MEMTMVDDKKSEEMTMGTNQFYGSTLDNKMVNPKDICLNFMTQKKEALTCDLDLAKIKCCDAQMDPTSGYSYIAEKRTDVEVLKAKIELLGEIINNFASVMI